jgi:hypothetical protein
MTGLLRAKAIPAASAARGQCGSHSQAARIFSATLFEGLAQRGAAARNRFKGARATGTAARNRSFQQAHDQLLRLTGNDDSTM